MSNTGGNGRALQIARAWQAEGGAGNSGTGGSPVESRYAAMFDRYSGRRRESAAFFVGVKPSVAALEVVRPKYRPAAMP